MANPEPQPVASSYVQQPNSSTRPPLPDRNTSNTNSFGSASRVPPPAPPPAVVEDEQHSAWGKRFVGNLLVSRAVRAGVTSTASSAKLPLTLSPWGDNNPVTLPNVRTRDIFFAGASHFGGDVIVQGLGETLTWSGDLMKEAISTFSEHVVESTVLDPHDEKKMVEAAGLLERITQEEIVVLQTTAVKSLKTSVKHKLIGIDANIQLFQPRPCPILNRGSCARGWFCPYLYATGRTPHISRSEDFAIAQLTGPALEADAKIAHALWAESAAVLPLCDPRPSADVQSHRMIVLLAGISPWRLHAWSQSRIPDGARFQFHLINGCPAIVIPVLPQAPVVAWSQYTLKQMHGKDYHPEAHYTELMRGLFSILNLAAVEPMKQAHYKTLIAKGIKMILRGAIETKGVEKKVWEMIDPERTGVVMFRY